MLAKAWYRVFTLTTPEHIGCIRAKCRNRWLVYQHVYKNDPGSGGVHVVPALQSLCDRVWRSQWCLKEITLFACVVFIRGILLLMHDLNAGWPVRVWRWWKKQVEDYQVAMQA